MVAHNTGSSRHIGKRMNRQKQGSPPWMLSAAPESVYGMNRGLRRRRPRYLTSCSGPEELLVASLPFTRWQVAPASISIECHGKKGNATEAVLLRV